MNLLITQNSQNVSHTHSEESAGSHSHSTNTTKNSAGTANKTLTGWARIHSNVGIINKGYGGTSGIFSAGTEQNVGVWGNDGVHAYNLNIDATHSHTTDSQGSHTHTINSSGGTETRTVNYSYKVWKRVS